MVWDPNKPVVLTFKGNLCPDFLTALNPAPSLAKSIENLEAQKSLSKHHTVVLAGLKQKAINPPNIECQIINTVTTDVFTSDDNRINFKPKDDARHWAMSKSDFMPYFANHSLNGQIIAQKLAITHNEKMQAQALYRFKGAMISEDNDVSIQDLAFIFADNIYQPMGALSQLCDFQSNLREPAYFQNVQEGLIHEDKLLKLARIAGEIMSYEIHLTESARAKKKSLAYT